MNIISLIDFPLGISHQHPEFISQIPVHIDNQFYEYDNKYS